ncbi:hypothetical protein SLEP1_g48767 [Rubroshorea leprosula]|uniref:HD-ZIP protein N-terminal domain-containing protein n=1 Tax=Rubroshorea leprosula TaxID=152421 RepID=A0AAV5LWZ9_9ROSI|nr:hypothetical protein SLEP1_g48767 [Rubroshorea leprosula]
MMENHHQNNTWTELFHSSGIDVNRAPSVAECEEEAVVSSPNSTISSINGKRSERDAIGDENKAEGASCFRESDDEDGGGGGGSLKKLRLSKEQSMIMEETFKEHSTLNPVSSSWNPVPGFATNPAKVKTKKKKKKKSQRKERIRQKGKKMGKNK